MLKAPSQSVAAAAAKAGNGDGGGDEGDDGNRVFVATARADRRVIRRKRFRDMILMGW